MKKVYILWVTDNNIDEVDRVDPTYDVFGTLKRAQAAEAAHRELHKGSPANYWYKIEESPVL